MLPGPQVQGPGHRAGGTEGARNLLSGELANRREPQHLCLIHADVRFHFSAWD